MDAAHCIHAFPDFIRCLEKMDFSSLPGLQAQLIMAPAIRHEDISLMGAGKSPVKSSVLLLFYPDARNQPMTVLIRRPEYDGAHSGQISFPGGRYEPDDRDLAFTALRETWEEIGVNPQEVVLVGKLTDLFIPPSNFLVSPYIGTSEKRPDFRQDPKEVAAILEFPLKDLLNPACREMTTLTLRDGLRLETPCFLLNGHVIWGATAMIISEMAAIIESL